MTMIDDVKAFHDKFGVPAVDKPQIPGDERIALRERLISEEYEELMVALGFCSYHSDMGSGWQRCTTTSLPETADAIADLIYVLIGTAHEFGIPLRAVWDAVHVSNMAKVGGGQDSKGKIQKPPGWVAPDVAGVLEAHGWKGESQ